MLNELKAYKNLDVYVTGSNPKGLSKDITTEKRRANGFFRLLAFLFLEEPFMTNEILSLSFGRKNLLQQGGQAAAGAQILLQIFAVFRARFLVK